MLPRLFLFLLVLLMASLSLTCAQDASSPDSDTAPPGSTVITSDELRSDQNAHTSTFTGNVTVTGTNFNMTCEEMTVIFTKDSKIDHIIATGNVIITQPGRVTHSGKAEYFRDEDKFVLTDQPNILDNKNQVFAPIITIFRTDQKMITSGGPSKVILINSGIDSSTPSTPAGN